MNSHLLAVSNHLGKPYADVNDKSAEMCHSQVITAVNSSSLHVVLLYKVFWAAQQSRTVTFCIAKSLATRPHLNCRYNEFCTHQQRQIRVDILPTLLPSRYPTPTIVLTPIFLYFFHPFYKSELVALEKWVWKFEMRHHYVVKFLVLF